MSTMVVLLVICVGAVWFFIRFLVALYKDGRRAGACPVSRIEPEERYGQFELADPFLPAPAADEAAARFGEQASNRAQVVVMNRRAAVPSSNLPAAHTEW